MTRLYTSQVGLIFSHGRTLAIGSAGADQQLEVPESHVPVILECFVHHHSLQEAYRAYRLIREGDKAPSPALAGVLRRVLAGDGGKVALVMVRDKVFVCPPESIVEAYRVAAVNGPQPLTETNKAAFNIYDLTALSGAAAQVAATLHSHFHPDGEGYPELTFEEFGDLVERLSRDGLLAVPIGAIDFGDFRGQLPFCPQFGSLRGTPIDRYYLEKFIAEIRGEVIGNTLEIGGKKENRVVYGVNKVTRYLAMDLAGEGLDFVGDAHDPGVVEKASLDSVIIFNVLEHCQRPWVVVDNIHEWLNDSGQVFCMVPNAQRVHHFPKDYWRILPDAMESLFARFPHRKLYVYGNALTTIASCMGVAAEELGAEELDAAQENYPVASCIHAWKADRRRTLRDFMGRRHSAAL